MDLDTYQEKAKETAIYPPEQGTSYCALGLCNEAGEVAGKLKKSMRDGHTWSEAERKEHRTKVADELGDTLWYLAMLASELGFSLDSIAQRNLNKLHDRAERNVIGGSGDSR